MTEEQRKNALSTMKGFARKVDKEGLVPLLLIAFDLDDPWTLPHLIAVPTVDSIDKLRALLQHVMDQLDDMRSAPLDRPGPRPEDN